MAHPPGLCSLFCLVERKRNKVERGKDADYPNCHIPSRSTTKYKSISQKLGAFDNASVPYLLIANIDLAYSIQAFEHRKTKQKEPSSPPAII